jgi:hypothetical protein
MTKPNYEISFSKYAYYDTDIRDSTDIILESPVLLKEHKDLKNTIISHMGAINNATIHEYFAIKNTTKDKVTIKIPTYPMLPFPVAIKESIKRHSIYNDIKNKYKNKSELDRYIEKAKRETDIQWRIHKSVDNKYYS